MAVAALVSGCLGADEEVQPASGPPRAVAEAVQRLERATAEDDYATICDDLLTAAARERAGGRDCTRLTRSAAREIARPRIDVRAISLEGDRAEVRVVTRARDQAAVSDVLWLRREGGEWRVEGLGD
jgi:hypothetical protein